MSIYEYKIEKPDGKWISLSEYRDHVLLVVNTASRCGFTPQYTELELIYQELRRKKFSILAFPCNQFGNQEPGNNQEIAHFCKSVYRISFDIFAKIEVKGKNIHPLFEYLSAQKPGILGTKAIKWNFTKFLVTRQGHVVQRFSPNSSPLSFKENILAHIN